MRSYYAQDWKCDCEPEHHSLENHLKGLQNIFQNAKVHYDEQWIYVDTNETCILATDIFQAEFHGLILSSIHATTDHHIDLLFFRPDKQKEASS